MGKIWHCFSSTLTIFSFNDQFVRQLSKRLNDRRIIERTVHYDASFYLMHFSSYSFSSDILARQFLRSDDRRCHCYLHYLFFHSASLPPLVQPSPFVTFCFGPLLPVKRCLIHIVHKVHVAYRAGARLCCSLVKRQMLRPLSHKKWTSYFAIYSDVIVMKLMLKTSIFLHFPFS